LCAAREIVLAQAGNLPGFHPRLRISLRRRKMFRVKHWARRGSLAVQGDVNEFVSIYLQPDFAVAVSNQTTGERREGFVQPQRNQ